MFKLLALDPRITIVIIVISATCILPVLVLGIIVFIKQCIKQKRNVKKLKETESSTSSKKKKIPSVSYLTYFGDEDNIVSVSKNLSRVTIVVKALDKVDLESLKDQGVGVMITGNTIKCSSQAFADQISE